MKASDVHPYETASVEIRADIPRYLVAGDRECLNPEGTVQQLGVVAKVLAFAIAYGSIEETREEEVALHPLGFEKGCQILPRSLSFRQYAIGPRLTKPADQLFAAWPYAAACHAAVSTGRGLPDRLPVEELNAASGSRKFDGRRQSRIAATDDGDIASGDQRHHRQSRECAIVPPVRSGLERTRGARIHGVHL
ncbi:hypothetical protein MesoLj131a_23740 [Mesorhizobium sp. 131-2-1]|nr:hypothetical protein MesoLj131a_23740 [Mesorhizobium sp. 131-2-1]